MMTEGIANQVINNEFIKKEDEKINYVTHIVINNKEYAFKALVTEYYPLTCTKCGGQVELNNGIGTCPYCKTTYSATIMLKEVC